MQTIIWFLLAAIPVGQYGCRADIFTSLADQRSSLCFICFLSGDVIHEQLGSPLTSSRLPCRLVISDIDGTITKSDLLGHLLPRVGFDWSHRGVTRLFTNIKANGYVFMFLSSRAIAQASATRDYLHTLNQDGETLPPGPVIISPDGLFPSLYRELVRMGPQAHWHELLILTALVQSRCIPLCETGPFWWTVHM